MISERTNEDRGYFFLFFCFFRSKEVEEVGKKDVGENEKVWRLFEHGKTTVLLNSECDLMGSL